MNELSQLAEAVPKAKSPEPMPEVPTYRALNFLACSIFVVSSLCLILVLIGIVIGLFQHDVLADMVVMSIPLVLSSIGGLGLGSALLALRDMAINSWHQRHALERLRRK